MAVFYTGFNLTEATNLQRKKSDQNGAMVKKRGRNPIHLNKLLKTDFWSQYYDVKIRLLPKF